MEYKEAPSVEGARRSLVYPTLTWLSKLKFLELIEGQRRSDVNEQKIYPYLDLNDGERIFIGKSIPSLDGEGVKKDNYHNENPNLEVIGTVAKNLVTCEWQLSVPHGSGVTVIKNNFLVLSLPDPECFYWEKANNSKIPLNSLRAAVDEFTCEYFYAGRSRFYDKKTPKPEYYRNNQCNKFNETIPPVFGKVHRGHSCFYAPVNDLELAFKEYDILCLKPSPSRLKILARSVLRKLLNYSNEIIELVNKNKSGKRYLPSTLINFVKYPSSLSVGEYMLQDEKIVAEDGKCEVCIKSEYLSRNLVCRSIITAEERNKLSKEDLQRLNEEQFERIICHRVNSIWLHRFKVVFLCAFNYNKDEANVFKSFYDKSPEYKLCIKKSDTSDIPNLVCEIIDEI